MNPILTWKICLQRIKFPATEIATNTTGSRIVPHARFSKILWVKDWPRKTKETAWFHQRIFRVSDWWIDVLPECFVRVGKESHTMAWIGSTLISAPAVSFDNHFPKVDAPLDILRSFLEKNEINDIYRRNLHLSALLNQQGQIPRYISQLITRWQKPGKTHVVAGTMECIMPLLWTFLFNLLHPNNQKQETSQSYKSMHFSSSEEVLFRVLQWDFSVSGLRILRPLLRVCFIVIVLFTFMCSSEIIKYYFIGNSCVLF